MKNNRTNRKRLKMRSRRLSSIGWRHYSRFHHLHDCVVYRYLKQRKGDIDLLVEAYQIENIWCKLLSALAEKGEIDLNLPAVGVRPYR